MSDNWDDTTIRVEALRLAILAIEKGTNSSGLGMFELAGKIYGFLTGTQNEQIPV
ncbi:MAG: hypothetical protein LUQ65_05650 [Candidatus Helarchaeota archaeon]|nr:hypothetical protein [Candidatus Helarchaeota archaeon]